jgi:uncharacterized phosphosugar-binding protein
MTPHLTTGGFIIVMKAYIEYHKLITELMNTIVRDEKDSLLKAANIMADTIENGKLIYVFGTGDIPISVQRRCSTGQAVWYRLSYP